MEQFRVYILNIRGIKMYYTGKDLIHAWSGDITKALVMSFKEACRIKSHSRERYIEEVTQ